MKKFLLFLLFAVSLSGARAQTVESGYVPVDGGRIYYESAGSGEPIVLIHDGLIHHEIWDAQFAYFSNTYRVIRYDRRGYGKSSLPTAPYSNIDDLTSLFDHCGVEQATVFGMSAGGGLAIDFTLAHPEHVSALVLAGAVVSGYGYTEHMRTRGGRIDLAEMAADPEKIIQYFGWEDPYEISPDNIAAKERCLQLLQEYPHNARLELQRLARPPERAAVRSLSEIRVPALVLVGEHDIPDVHAHAGAIEAGIPAAKREIIYKAGHLIPLEQPEAFNAAVMNFLNSAAFMRFLINGDVAGAVRYFHKIREQDPDIMLFREAELNAIGYGFLQQEKIEDAIVLFRLNVEAFPDSWNVYDSLGEAYLRGGQTEAALKHYRKSLERNPGNSNAKKVISELTADK